MLETQGLEAAADALRTGRVTTLVAAATAASVRGLPGAFIATTGPDDPLIITRETSHFAIADALLHGCDFAVSPAAPEPGLTTMSLGSIPLNAYVAADHEWASDGVTELPLSALSATPPSSPPTRASAAIILDDALNQAHLSFREVSECDDGQTIMALAAAGHGIGVTTDLPPTARTPSASWPARGQAGPRIAPPPARGLDPRPFRGGHHPGSRPAVARLPGPAGRVIKDDAKVYSAIMPMRHGDH